MRLRSIISNPLRLLISFVLLGSSSSNLYFLSFVFIFLLEPGDSLIRDPKLCKITEKHSMIDIPVCLRNFFKPEWQQAGMEKA